ncbi:glycosyltransferase family 2 protein [Geomonas agri]|uniref:glycosyltransferase family 2 protein n=1 Tax=Geomonas agri TaxID=2873702 RepID=UPI001CD805EA|nr:glycosyltransferase family 2 protein [Geomonas agri]
MKPFLSITIPTYNRCETLKANLSKIVEELDSEIEILVSDNASTDGTEALCRQYQERFSFFNYHRNEFNLGYDLNVLNCVELCSGHYIWFLSDDDFVNGKLIKEVVAELKKEKPDGALINATVVNPQSGIVLIDNLGGCNTDYLTLVGTAEFIDYSKWATLISSLIVRRDLIEFNPLSEHVGSCFIQVPLFWRALYQRRLYVLGSKRIIKNDGIGDNFNQHSSKLWLLNWIATISSLCDLYTLESCRRAATSLYPKAFYAPGSLVMHVIQARGGGVLSSSNKKVVVDGLDINFAQRLLIDAIVYVPVSLVDCLFWIARRFARVVRTARRRLDCA